MTESNRKILVADDDFYMRSIVKVGLSKVAEIIEATTGTEVLDLYKKHKPAMVILDIHLPGKSGHEVLKEILAFDPSAYICMLSADSVVENVRESQTVGAKGFIAKPFTKEILLRQVQRCPAFGGFSQAS